jgi:DNA replication protein DnaC
MKNKTLIETTAPAKEFEQYLNLIGNEKIIFSGIFGIGKTYF